VVMEGQRREQQPHSQSRLQEYFSRSRTPFGWLGRQVLGRADHLADRRDRVVSGQNGNGNGTHPTKAEPPATNEPQFEPTERELLVAKAVARATEKGWKADEQKFADDIVQPLKLGPQRYSDPAIWGPPEHLRPFIGGFGPNARERVPLTQDPRYAELGALFDELDSTLRWPDND
jgi:hypothetical protein